MIEKAIVPDVSSWEKSIDLGQMEYEIWMIIITFAFVLIKSK
jgi:hypothetical protein